jgi:microcystin-dependent protein
MGGTDAARLSVANTLGGSGGTETHTLTSAQIPAHSHINTLSNTTHTHTAGKYDALGIANAGVAAGVDYQAVIASGSAATTRILSNNNSVNVSITNANNTGGDGAHNNMQPYILINYIIKT